MPARFLLIDGYNLLYAAGMARVTYGPGDLQRCRERLLRFLAAGLTPAERERTTVIFDARHPPPDRPARQRHDEITVEFANPGGDADIAIQDWLAAHSAPHRVTLVSGDRVLQRAARRRRARCLESTEFIEHLERRRARGGTAGGQEPDDKPPDPATGTETAQWMQYFGDLGTFDLREEPAGEAAPSATAPQSASTTEAPPSTGQAARRKVKRRNPKRSGLSAPEELDYWREIFGTLPNFDELRQGRGIAQADLERWLAEFEDEGD